MRPVVLEVDLRTVGRRELLDLKDLFQDHPGPVPVDLLLIEPGSFQVYLQSSAHVEVSERFRRDLARI